MSSQKHRRACVHGHARSSIKATLWTTVVAVAAAGAAFGADESGTDGAKLEEVVVTGSLIRRPNQESSSPILSADLDALRQTADTSLVGQLNQLPQFNATSGSQSGGQGTGGHVTVNLRGLGSNRNLVLLDGHRLPLADISGNVDINLVPEAAVGTVDVITGGASAVYGSDAMSGVVNFLTIPYFDGIKGDLQYGNSSRGDVEQKSASFALGTGFGENKGRLVMAFGYTDRELLSGFDRKFFDLVTPSSFIGQSVYVPEASNAPNQADLDALFAGYGYSPIPNTSRLGFNDDGTLFNQNGAQNYKGPTTGLYAVLGGNVRMPVGRQTIIVNPVDRKSAFSKFDYEFTPNFTLYGQFMYVDSDVYTESGGSLTQFGTLTTVPVTNPFIPASLQALLATRPNPTAPFTWNGRYVGIPYKGWDEMYTTAQYLAGLKGELPFGDWTYDAFASYDTTDHNQSMYYAVLKSRVQTLLNAPDGGNSICAGGFNIFGVVNTTNLSQACLDYVTTTAHSQEKLTQDYAQAMVQGSLFELPAGKVKLALLVDKRRNTYAYTPDTSLAAQDIEAVIASAPAKGSIDVTEYATQIEVPLLADAPFAKSLTLGAAYRYSDYSSSGGVNAYEGDLKWRPVESVLLRTGFQRAVRAPNIGELYAAAQGVQVAFGNPPGALGDPCDIRSIARTGAGGSSVRQLCIDQGIPASIIDSYVFPTTATGGVQSGNPNLDPESADTFNVGVQWTSQSESELMGKLSVSVDYYSIDIADVISVVPGLTTLSKCYNLDGSNTSYSVSNPFCQLLHRDSNGQLELIETPYFNLGSLKTDGVDVQVNWAPTMASLGMNVAGSLLFSSYIGYAHSYDVQTIAGSATQDYINTIAVGSSHPRWKAMTTLGYRGAALTAGVRWRYLGAMDDVTSVTTPASPLPGTSDYNTFDVFGSYDFNDRLQFRAGVNNVTDELSKTVSSSQNSTDTSVYDPVGRSYYIGMRLSM